MDERRRLTRDRDERMLAGVCSGIAKHFDLDPTLVRIVFVILAFVSGVGIIAYVVLWLLLPGPERSDAGPRQLMRDNVEEMAERARLAAAAAQAAAEAARQAADQLTETARAAGRAARDTWQQGSQPASGGDASTGAPDEPAGAGAPMDAAAEGVFEPEDSGKPGQTTPERSQTPWPPSRELPSTDAMPEPPAGESQSAGPPPM